MRVESLPPLRTSSHCFSFSPVTSFCCFQKVSPFDNGIIYLDYYLYFFFFLIYLYGGNTIDSPFRARGEHIPPAAFPHIRCPQFCNLPPVIQQYIKEKWMDKMRRIKKLYSHNATNYTFLYTFFNGSFFMYRGGCTCPSRASSLLLQIE